MTWPWPGLRSDFEIDLSGQKYIFRTRSTRKTRWCHFHFRVSYQKVIKKTSPWKHDIFYLMTSGAKAIELKSNRIAKCRKSIIRAYHCFRRIFPSYHIFGDNSACLRKITIFSKLHLSWPLVTSILTWPETDLCKALRSCHGISYAAYRLSLSSEVFEIGWGFLKPPPPATNRTF